MYFNEYQQLAERTARTTNDTPEKRFINFSLTATGIWVVPNNYYDGETRWQEEG